MFFLCVAIFSTFSAHASMPIDSTDKIKKKNLSDSIGVVSNLDSSLLADIHLNQQTDVALSNGDKHAISKYIRFLQGNKDLDILNSKTYYNLAILFARMKNYPLALKYFAKSGALESDSLITEKYKRNFSVSLSKLNLPQLLTDTTEDNPLVKVGNDTLSLASISKSSGRSREKINYHQIMKSFRPNRKDALGYAVLLHVKQPKYGERKQFLFLNNVGHMFVTLVQFINDTTSICKTFGFYPKKNNFLSATPLMPKTSGTFKDDEHHDWDEMVGRFVSYRQFKEISHMIARYNKSKYHLNKNNCTDFGLCIATIAGINIKDTKGSWPLGGGNDPGDAGQSILEGKILSTAGSNKDLFICINPDVKN